MSPESTSRGFSISNPAGSRSTSRMRPPVSVASTFSTTTRRSFCLSLAVPPVALARSTFLPSSV
jgi:hypothetical protein